MKLPVNWDRRRSIEFFIEPFTLNEENQIQIASTWIFIFYWGEREDLSKKYYATKSEIEWMQETMIDYPVLIQFDQM